MNDEIKLVLSKEEQRLCLKEINKKLTRIIYVYEKSQEQDSEYDNYKIFVSSVMLYVSSSNILFNGELINIIVNLVTILNNDFDKLQLKKIIFECKNITKFILTQVGDLNG
jgi:hypothetical protein